MIKSSQKRFWHRTQRFVQSFGNVSETYIIDSTKTLLENHSHSRFGSATFLIEPETFLCRFRRARLRYKNVLETFVNHTQNIKIVKYSISNPSIDGVVQSIQEKTFPGNIRNVYSSKAYWVLFEVISVLLTDNINYYNFVVEMFQKRNVLCGVQYVRPTIAL